MASVVEGVVKTKALVGCQEQDRGVPSEHLNIAALFVIIAANYLMMGKCDFRFRFQKDLLLFNATQGRYKEIT